MKKGGLLVLISVLLVFMAGCSYHEKAGTSTSAHPVPESQQTAPGPTTTSSTEVQKNQTSKSISTTSPNNGELLNQGEPSPILLYSIQGDLKSGNNEFPNYELGNVQSQPILSYQEWINRGGHQPWRRDPFSIVQVLTSNLIPEYISNNSNNKWTESGNMATNNNGVVIKLISPDGDSLHNSSNATELTYRMIVPRLGSYDITVQQPQGSVFFIITKIVFNSNSFN